MQTDEGVDGIAFVLPSLPHHVENPTGPKRLTTRSRRAQSEGARPESGFDTRPVPPEVAHRANHMMDKDLKLGRTGVWGEVSSEFKLQIR